MIFKKSIPAIFFLLIQLSLAMGQTGTIEGMVQDKRTKETLVGAQIVIQGTTIGTSANLNGEFRLSNIPEGIVNLAISFISYEPVIIENIKIERGRTINLFIEMQEIIQTLEGVTITARRTTYTEASLLNSIRTSQVVASGISAQQISRTQDSDAAEVVKRIPGVTISDDKFIIVRGLSERYNVVMLHNVYAPSMEADVRSFSFDMIPSSQIDRLMIFKSPSPDLPGDFAGGAIKIYTKSIPDKTGFEFSFSNRYDDGTSFQPFYQSPRANNAWLGYGKEYFELPASFPEDLRRITNNPEALQTAGRSLKNNWIPEQNEAFLNQSVALSGNLRFKIRNIHIGNISTITYSNSKSFNAINRSDFNAYNMDQGQRLPIYEFEDSKYSNNIKVGLLHNWGVDFAPGHSMEIVNLYNNISSYNYVNRLGDHMDFGAIMNNHSFQQVFRGLYSGQISAKHQLFKNTHLDWSAGYNSSFRDMPDYKQYRTERPNYDPDGDYYITYIPTGGAQPYFLGRFFSNMKETGHTYTANLSQKIPMSAQARFIPEIKTGIFSNYLERDFKARNIGYTQAVNFNQDLRFIPIDLLFQDANINNSGGIKIDEQSNPQDSYFASNDLQAAYVMVVLPFGEKLNISGGVRMENNQKILQSATTSGAVNKDNTEQHLLPSMNLTYNINKDWLIRAGYGKTVNRPEFRENAPFGFFDFDYNYVVTGFEHLKTAEIANYDLRLEYYPSPNEVVSLAGFYKSFDNAIERAFLPGAGSGGAKNFSFGNADKASMYGAEVEIRKSLAGISNLTFLDNFSIYLNSTLLTSTVEIGQGSRSEGRDTDPRPLQGQSPYIVNAGLFYNNIKSDLQINLTYNIIGKRIYSGGFRELDRTTVSYPDVYEMPRNFMDLTVSKRINSRISLKAGLKDILNEPIVLMQDANQDGKFENNKDQVISTYRPGISASLGVSFKL